MSRSELRCSDAPSLPWPPFRSAPAQQQESLCIQKRRICSPGSHGWQSCWSTSCKANQELKLERDRRKTGYLPVDNASVERYIMDMLPYWT
eukprot:768672-Hanusia_phi.AAC.23